MVYNLKTTSSILMATAATRIMWPPRIRRASAPRRRSVLSETRPFPPHLALERPPLASHALAWMSCMPTFSMGSIGCWTRSVWGRHLDSAWDLSLPPSRGPILSGSAGRQGEEVRELWDYPFRRTRTTRSDQRQRRLVHLECGEAGGQCRISCIARRCRCCPHWCGVHGTRVLIMFFMRAPTLVKII